MILSCKNWIFIHSSVRNFLILLELLIDWWLQFNILSHRIGNWGDCGAGFSQNRAINLACKWALLSKFTDLDCLWIYAHNLLLAHILALGISLEMLWSLFLSCASISFLYLITLFFERLNLIILKVYSSYCINLLCKPRHCQLIAIKRIFLYFYDFRLTWFDLCWTTTMIDTRCLECSVELFNCLLPKNTTWKGHAGIYCLLPLLHFLLDSILVNLCWVVSHWINSLYFLNKCFVSFIPLVSIQLLLLKWLQWAAFYSLLNNLCL